MRIKNYDQIKDTEKFKEIMIELGFRLKRRPNNRYDVKEWCWEVGSRKGNSAPEIFICDYQDDSPDDEDNGKIMMYMTNAWYFRELPDVVIELARRGMLDIELEQNKNSNLRRSNI